MIYHKGTDDLNGLDDHVRKATKTLRKHLDDFDSIAVRGMSGVVIGVPVSMRLKKPLVIVRKPGENQHGKKIINADASGERAVFLDDFVAGGETRDAVVQALEPRTKIVAQYLYRDDKYMGSSPSSVRPRLDLLGLELLGELRRLSIREISTHVRAFWVVPHDPDSRARSIGNRFARQARD